MLFKRSIKRLESNDSLTGNILRKQIEKSCLFIQSGWAKWMAKKTAGLSSVQLLIFWGLFLAFSAVYSMYLIAVSFSGKATNTLTEIPVMQRVMPLQINEVTIRKNTSISKSHYERIHRFRIYMDSLAGSSEGKRVYDSIVNKHSGLLDSIAIIENYYQFNFKNQ